MSEPRDDLKQRAINLADTIILEREVNGQSMQFTRWASDMIAAALAEERERCAKLAEEAWQSDPQLVAAIRNPVEGR